LFLKDSAVLNILSLFAVLLQAVGYGVESHPSEDATGDAAGRRRNYW
jgi:hypothetical protein